MRASYDRETRDRDLKLVVVGRNRLGADDQLYLSHLQTRFLLLPLDYRVVEI